MQTFNNDIYEFKQHSWHFVKKTKRFKMKFKIGDKYFYIGKTGYLRDFDTGKKLSTRAFYGSMHRHIFIHKDYIFQFNLQTYYPLEYYDIINDRIKLVKCSRKQSIYSIFPINDAH